MHWPLGRLAALPGRTEQALDHRTELAAWRSGIPARNARRRRHQRVRRGGGSGCGREAGAGDGGARRASRHRATIASSSTSRTYTGGPSGIRRHSAILRLRPLTTARTSSSERRSWTVSVSPSISLRSRSGVGSSSSADTPSRRM